MRIRVSTLPGYEHVLDRYYVDEFGAVFSFDKELVQSFNSSGYRTADLKIDGERRWKHCLVHRLVALAFVPNPEGFPEVNHMDENKLNNRSSNLEWCTHAYNNSYGTKPQRLAEIKGFSCYVYDFRLNFIGRFESLVAASDFIGLEIKALNTKVRGYYVLSKPNLKLVLSINAKSNYRSVVITNIETHEKFYFYSTREARRFFDNKVNVSDAIKNNWTVYGLYKVRALNYKKLIGMLDL